MQLGKKNKHGTYVAKLSREELNKSRVGSSMTGTCVRNNGGVSALVFGVSKGNGLAISFGSLPVLSISTFC
jgi:hypothetical protein